jgi:hypothetical protein
MLSANRNFTDKKTPAQAELVPGHPRELMSPLRPACPLWRDADPDVSILSQAQIEGERGR